MIIPEPTLSFLRRLIDGRSYKEIGAEFHCHENTVKYYITRLKKEHNCQTTFQMVAKLVRLGLVN